MKKVLKNRLSLDSIIVKSTIEIAVPVFLLIIALSVVFYKSSMQSINNQILDSNNSELSSIADVYDKIFESVSYSLNYIYINGDVSMFFAAENPYEAENIYNLNTQQILEDIKAPVDYINSINIYVSNKNGSFQITTKNSDNINIKSFPWFESSEIMTLKDGFYTFPCAFENNYPYFISFVRKITKNDNTCFITVNVDLKELNRFVLKDRPERLYLIKDNKIIYNRYMQKMMLDISDDKVLSKADDLSEGNSFFVEESNVKYAVSLKNSQIYDWSYLIVNSVDNNMAEKNGRRLIIYIFIISLILLGFFISFKYVTSIYKPIHQIEGLLEGEKISNKKTTSVEIRNISDKIMDFANRNEELKNELDKRLEILKKYQLYSLRAQINPHFMFNVLNTIYMQSISDYKIDRKTSSMLLGISQYLRYVLDGENETSDIETEIKYSKIYVEFLQKRYEQLKYVKWDISDSIKNHRILKLLLQPILENAVYHGICRKKTEDGSLIVKGCEQEGDIILSVTDNGIGMDKNKLFDLRNSLKNNQSLSSEHIGLNNIDRRIKLLYGKSYGIEIESEYNKGTTIKIILPKM